MKLSIIIPYYKCLKYTKRLFEVLEPQIDENVEIIIVDDGCNEKELEKLNAKVIHLKENSGGASKPRTSLCIKEYVYFYNNGRPGSITTGGEPE